MYFIYKVENKIDGKLYVGQTICPRNRRKQHLSRTPHGNPVLDRAVLKYGGKSFEFAVIEEVETLEEANKREIHWIKELGTLVPGGYNLKEGGEAGGIDSPETRKKKRLSKLGNKNGFYGRKHSDETKRKISEAKMGQSLKISEDDLSRRSSRMIELNKSRIGKKLSDNHKRHIAAGQKGKTHSEGTKRKMSESRRKWWVTQSCNTFNNNL